jgi:DNA-binding GntR family transcriptional regulator
VSKSAKKTKSTANIENTETRHLRIYKEIRERISLLKYTPGTVLSETELAHEFEVSRTPIRRVLQRLHHEGLTEVRNGIGTIVKDIDLKTLKEIYDLRMHLAELMGELSPTEFTKSQLDTLRQLLKDAKALKKQQDYEAYARLCNSLEDVILTMIGSTPLREITDILYYRVSRIWFTFLPHLKWKELVGFQEEEIASMIEAVKMNDLKGVGQIRRLHLHGILTYLSNYLTNQTTK